MLGSVKCLGGSVRVFEGFGGACEGFGVSVSVFVRRCWGLLRGLGGSVRRFDGFGVCEGTGGFVRGLGSRCCKYFDKEIKI